MKWTEVTSLGDDAFFIGNYNSLSISSQNLLASWKRNCIYFTNAYIEGHIDGIIGGIYDLKNKRIEPMPGYASDPMIGLVLTRP